MIINVGLEIHQQLQTSSKLFCRCKVGTTEKEGKKILRKLHLSESELGTLDIAAKREILKNKWIIYEIFDEYNCLVDIDEEPPKEINKEALDIALKIASYCNCYIPDELHVMRKIIIDGSIPTGFQRTLIVGLNGRLKFLDIDIPINTICLEEESGRKIKEDEKFIYFKLDRLGIPLIEITTGIIKLKPEEVNKIKNIAYKIGLFLRMFNVRRGLGTIRQDLNVSINNLDRVEIKGVQDLDLLPKVILNEAKRQYINLTKIKPILENSIIDKPIELTDLFRNTKSKIILKNLEKGMKIFGFKIENAKGLFKIEINEGKRFGKEIAEYVGLYSYVKGILHRDELPNYGITEKEVEEVEKKLKVGENDNFILYMCFEKDREFIYNLILERLNQYKNIAVRETRKANPDGTTTYLRPMPTSSRMYPETDLFPIKVENIENIKKEINNYINDVINTLLNYFNDEKFVYKLIEKGFHNNFYYIIKKYSDKIDKNLLKKYFYDLQIRFDKNLNLKDLEKIIVSYINNKITKEAIEYIIKEYNNNNLDYLLEKYKKLPKEEVIKLIKKFKKENKSKGEIIKFFRGKYDLKEVMKILSSEFNEDS